MNAAAIVGEAAQRFGQGDDAPFVACFDAAVRVYSEPEASSEQVIGSRAELADALARVRRALPELSATVERIAEHGEAALADVIIGGDPGLPGVWRVALAVAVADSRITEVRVFRTRGAAVHWLNGNRELTTEFV